MKELKLEDYKVEYDQADYLLTIEGRVYIETEFYSFTNQMSVSSKIYGLEDKPFNKIIDDYVKKYNPNVTSYSIKLKEIEKIEERKELTFTVSIPEQDKANTWIDEQRETHKHKGVTSGERFGYQFIPTGLGVCVAVVDLLTGKSKDVTDPLNW